MKFAAANTLLSDPSAANFAIFHDHRFKETVTQDFQVDSLLELPCAASVLHNGSFKFLGKVYGQLFGWIATQGETIAGPVREIYHVSAMNSPKF